MARTCSHFDTVWKSVHHAITSQKLWKYQEISHHELHIEPLALKISWLTKRNWLMQESPGLNPDWFGESRLFFEKKLT